MKTEKTPVPKNDTIMIDGDEYRVLCASSGSYKGLPESRLVLESGKICRIRYAGESRIGLPMRPVDADILDKQPVALFRLPYQRYGFNWWRASFTGRRSALETIYHCRLDWPELMTPVERQTIEAAKTTPPISASEKTPMKSPMLLYVAEKCSELDKGKTKHPGHWNVFRLAWQGLNPYQIHRDNPKWTRKTIENRIAKIEKDLLAGKRISSFQYDDALLRNAEREKDSGRKKGVILYARGIADPEESEEGEA